MLAIACTAAKMAGSRWLRCEPHFALRICQAVGLTDCNGSVQQMRTPAVHAAIETFMQRHRRSHIAAMAAQSDIPYT